MVKRACNCKEHIFATSLTTGCCDKERARAWEALAEDRHALAWDVVWAGSSSQSAQSLLDTLGESAARPIIKHQEDTCDKYSRATNKLASLQSIVAEVCRKHPEVLGAFIEKLIEEKLNGM